MKTILLVTNCFIHHYNTVDSYQFYNLSFIILPKLNVCESEIIRENNKSKCKNINAIIRIYIFADYVREIMGIDIRIVYLYKVSHILISFQFILSNVKSNLQLIVDNKLHKNRLISKKYM